MGFTNDNAQETAAREICELIEKKIEENRNHPVTIEVLKDMGREILRELPTVPQWTEHFGEIFDY